MTIYYINTSQKSEGPARYSMANTSQVIIFCVILSFSHMVVEEF